VEPPLLTIAGAALTHDEIAALTAVLIARASTDHTPPRPEPRVVWHRPRHHYRSPAGWA
jgi:hypothetical protein